MTVKYSRGALEEMTMDELKRAGKEYGAKGTREEMTKAIMAKQIPDEPDETENLLSDIARTRGDFNETYALRPRIEAALKKLKALEAKEVK